MVDLTTDAAEIQPARPSLKARVVRAGGWALGGYFSALVLRMAGSLVLTRILTPNVFGVLSIVTAIQVLVTLLTDVGIRQAVVRSPNGSVPSFLHTAWTLQVLQGAVIWVVGGLLALGLLVAGRWGLLPDGSVYAAQELPALVSAMMLTPLVLGFQSMKAVTANRELNLKHIVAIEVLSQAFYLALTITLGLATRSVWSYVWSGIAASCFTVALTHLWLQGPRDRFGWDGAALREIRQFGKWVFISSALSSAAMNGDRLLLGGWVSSSVLGFYSIANSLSSIGEQIANRMFGSVTLPTLSQVRREQPERFPALYMRLRLMVDTAVVPAAGFLFAAGPWIIGFLYDPRYGEAGWMLRDLSFSLLLVRYQLAQSAYLAIGRPNYITVLNVAKLISLFGLVPVMFVTFGIEGAVLGLALHMTPAALCTLVLNQRLGLNSLRVELAALLLWPLGWLGGTGFIALATTIQAVIRARALG